MNCPHCGASLLDSAPVCPTCGVPAESLAHQDSTLFSYLPADTPPWPNQTNVSSAVAAAMHLPAPSAEQAFTTKQTVKEQAPALSVLLVVALIIVTPLVGIAASVGYLGISGQIPSQSSYTFVQVPSFQRTPGAASSPTANSQGNNPPLPSSFLPTSKANTALHVSLKYPPDWVEDPPQPSSDGSLISVGIHPPQSQQQQFGMQFIVARYTSDASAKTVNSDEINRTNIQSLQGIQGVSNLQQITPSSPLHIGNSTENWKEQDEKFDIADAAGSTTPLRATSVAVQHAKIYYTILIIVPDDKSYDGSMQNFITPMLSFFQFLS